MDWAAVGHSLDVVATRLSGRTALAIVVGLLLAQALGIGVAAAQRDAVKDSTSPTARVDSAFAFAQRRDWESIVRLTDSLDLIAARITLLHLDSAVQRLVPSGVRDSAGINRPGLLTMAIATMSPDSLRSAPPHRFMIEFLKGLARADSLSGKPSIATRNHRAVLQVLEGDSIAIVVGEKRDSSATDSLRLRQRSKQWYLTGDALLRLVTRFRE